MCETEDICLAPSHEERTFAFIVRRKRRQKIIENLISCQSHLKSLLCGQEEEKERKKEKIDILINSYSLFYLLFFTHCADINGLSCILLFFFILHYKISHLIFIFN